MSTELENTLPSTITLADGVTMVSNCTTQALHAYAHVPLSSLFIDPTERQRLGYARPNNRFPVELHSGRHWQCATTLARHPRWDPPCRQRQGAGYIRIRDQDIHARGWGDFRPQRCRAQSEDVSRRGCHLRGENETNGTHNIRFLCPVEPSSYLSYDWRHIGRRESDFLPEPPRGWKAVVYASDARCISAGHVSRVSWPHQMAGERGAYSTFLLSPYSKIQSVDVFLICA